MNISIFIGSFATALITAFVTSYVFIVLYPIQPENVPDTVFIDTPVTVPAEIFTEEPRSIVRDQSSNADRTETNEVYKVDDLIQGLDEANFIDEQHKALELEVDSLRKQQQVYKDRNEVVPAELIVKLDTAIKALNLYFDTMAPVPEGSGT